MQTGKKYITVIYILKYSTVLLAERMHGVAVGVKTDLRKTNMRNLQII
jgi:hypothetical protein